MVRVKVIREVSNSCDGHVESGTMAIVNRNMHQRHWMGVTEPKRHLWLQMEVTTEKKAHTSTEAIVLAAVEASLSLLSP